MGMVSVEAYFTEWDGMRLLGKDRTYSEDRTLKKSKYAATAGDD